MKIKNIWFVSREYEGLAGAGGVKDVCRQLAEALSQQAKVNVILPCYGFMDAKLLGFRPSARLTVNMNYAHRERQEEVTIWRRKMGLEHGGALTLHLVEAERYSKKQGVYAYTEEEEALDPWHTAGQGHVDYFAMNVLLQKAALAYMVQANSRPHIIHCHDGHTALIPALAREVDGFRHFFKRTGFLVTIHNGGKGYHQEVADLPFAQAITGLPLGFINKHLLDGHFDPFIAAAPHAILNTVSENYAHELRSTDADELTGWLGHFLLSRGIKLRGVTNGIDPTSFNLPAPQDKEQLRQQLSRRLTGKLQVRCYGSLATKKKQPLLSFIGRFSAQKGVDVLVKAMHVLLANDPDFQLVVLGSGQADISAGLQALANDASYKGRVCLLEGFDPELAELIYGAGDFFVVPSQYEPCGLTDFIAQLHGNLPIVHHVGGLVKVVDGKTGFAYKSHSSLALGRALRRALEMYRQQPATIKAMQRSALDLIQARYTWDKVMERYMELYQEAACNV